MFTLESIFVNYILENEKTTKFVDFLEIGC